MCYSFYPSKNLGAFGDGGAIQADTFRIAFLRRHLQAVKGAMEAGSPVKGFLCEAIGVTEGLMVPFRAASASGVFVLGGLARPDLEMFKLAPWIAAEVASWPAAARCSYPPRWAGRRAPAC